MFNRIGSEEVMQSMSGQGPILGSTQTLLEDEVFSWDDYITVLYPR